MSEPFMKDLALAAVLGAPLMPSVRLGSPITKKRFTTRKKP
jgi:hypothetical protein